MKWQKNEGKIDSLKRESQQDKKKKERKNHSKWKESRLYYEHIQWSICLAAILRYSGSNTALVNTVAIVSTDIFLISSKWCLLFGLKLSCIGINVWIMEHPTGYKLCSV